jgi:hypothetical protein
MKLAEGMLEFDFRGAINGFKFDETDNTSPHYHGLTHCLKGVDFIIELPDVWLFVEVKDPDHPDSTDERKEKFRQKAESGKLVPELVQKYRDTFLYRWAENQVDKPICYLCLVTLENALVLQLMTDLKRQLPEGKPSVRWKQTIAQSCIVANVETWNHSFGHWPVNRVISE